MKTRPTLKARPSLSSLEILELSLEDRGPSVVYFALSARDSLSLDPFNQPASALFDQKIRVLSFDLPYHGKDLNPQDAMKRWAEHLQADPQFIDTYIQNVKADLEHLEDIGMIDLGKTALMGLSRGGYIALRLAAELRECKGVLAFAPLTNFSDLAEFKNELPESLIAGQSLNAFIPRLSGKKIKIHIGVRDTRVSTRASFEFLEALAEECYQNGIRTPPLEMAITPSIGHKGHGTSPGSFLEGALWMKRLFDSPTAPHAHP